MMRIQSCARSLLGLVIATALLVTGPSPGTAQTTGAIQGRVTEQGTGRVLAGAQVTLVGTGRGVVANATGEFLLPGLRPGDHQVQVQYVGFGTTEKTVRVTAGQTARADFNLSQTAISLDAVVVTALGQQAKQRSLGTAQQSVTGTDIVSAQKDNFVNALQGRVAGLEVTSTSGVPGASSQITLRGVSSVSGNNQPLIVIDGLPVDNRVMHTNVFASAATFENRGLDFTNRAADFNPEDIETLTVLKGAEAAALYGIDAANGAIVITTKRGKAGTGGFNYSNSIRMDFPANEPQVQNVYGPSTAGAYTWLFFGRPYPQGVTRYDNIGNFFQNSLTQKHNLSFSGASADSRVTYRLSASSLNSNGVIPTTELSQINVTAASQAEATSWLTTDASIQYSTSKNRQPIRLNGGALMGLLTWPDTINAADWLTPEGRRRRITTVSAASELDNPYFSTYRNRSNSDNQRTNVNVGLTLRPVSWANLKSNIGVDQYTMQNQTVRDPESSLGVGSNGILDEATNITRSYSAQTLLNFNRFSITEDLGIGGSLGNFITDYKQDVEALAGVNFLEPSFISMNNTGTRFGKTTISQRRLVSAFGQAQFDYKNYLFVNVTGRNDWTSTIPQERNSFFYPGVNGSFIFSDAFPSVGKHMTGKVRAAWAEVGKDADPYAYATAIEYRTSSYGGYSYGFLGPNPNLRPEFATSYEFGTELGFWDGRFSIDATVYRKETRDQIVKSVRSSYGSGFILINLNGASTRNEGLELTLRGTPIQHRDFSWDVQANFTKAQGKVLALPDDLPEYYNSDTWLVTDANVRGGMQKGSSTTSLTVYPYMRNKNGDMLIDPSSGLPIRDLTTFRDVGYDRQPDFLIGLTNRVQFKRFTLTGLLDIRKGGDVFNGTEWYLTRRGLSKRTLDREKPVVVQGVLRDGKENTDNPTKNTIVVVPAVNTSYYTAMSEEPFIEQDVNWLRLRDVTLRYALPAGFFGTRNASVYVTGTELFLLTNYTGMDPIVNGNTAATGGSGGMGIDFGNFPMPRGVNFGFSVGF